MDMGDQKNNKEEEMRQFPAIPDQNKILIVDISKWQDDPDTPLGVDFALMKSRKVSGVIMKVGQGMYVDRAWEAAVRSALEDTMPIGGYWYYDNRVEPKRQAKVMADALRDYPLPLGLWLDLEDKQEGAYKGWKNWYTFLEKLKELMPGKKIGIYTGYYYWTERTVMSQIPKASLQYFKQYPLWIASYNAVPLIPDPWKPDYLIWQFTDLLDGAYYGVESKELDGNYLNSDVSFDETFGISNTVSKEPTKKFIVGLQEYAITLGGTLEDIKIIEVTSKSNSQEAVKLMNYILELDRNQGA